MMASSKCPRSSWASELDAHPLSFFLSFHTLISLVHLLHGNPYSLTLISIDGHLYSPLIRLVDVRLSPYFLSSPQPTYSIPPIVLYPWLKLMYCVKVEKVWEHQKYETIAWCDTQNFIWIFQNFFLTCGRWFIFFSSKEPSLSK